MSMMKSNYLGFSIPLCRKELVPGIEGADPDYVVPGAWSVQVKARTYDNQQSFEARRLWVEVASRKITED